MKVLAGATLAMAATTAVAVPASATDFGVGNGDTAISGHAATDFATRNGNTAITGEVGGIANTYGAPFANVDLRCAVPLPEGEGIGGHALGGPKASCNLAPVNQYQAPQKLL
ncbi:hypothetical protein AB5J72_50600 [Streptomyces sp. CG1]|uniref:hypothetical protein n=1 Tax=Streptomyces sp. CG1 TaxID=1287523 RepID=UPI0034E2F48A